MGSKLGPSRGIFGPWNRRPDPRDAAAWPSLDCRGAAAGPDRRSRTAAPTPPGRTFVRNAGRWARRSAALLICALCLPTVASAEPEVSSPNGAGPTAVVDRLHAALLDVMKQAEALGYEGRHEKLAPVLQEVFDIAYMAEKSVGRYWRSADEAQRALLVETFTRFTIANYAGRFDGWSGQQFEVLSEAPSLHGTVLVNSRLVEEGADPVQLNYRLRPDGDGWRIIDVYLNGTVSEIALRRSEYSSLIQREGFDALLAALDDKITDLAASTPADQS